MADIEFITVGDEITSGATEDTNFSFAARELVSNGIEPPRRRISVGDNRDDIARAFSQCSASADFVVVSGGLGPTPDDLTAECAAEFFNMPLEPDTAALELVEAALKKIKRRMLPAHRKQAMIPRNAKIVPNHEGVSPGFVCESGKGVFYFLPGVPREFKAMLTGFVVADISKRAGVAGGFSLKAVSVFGIGESELAEKMKTVDLAGVKLSYRIKGQEIQVRVSHPQDRQAVLKAADRVAAHLGGNVFSTSGGSLEEAVAETLREKGLTVAVAESCTGGMLASRLTDIAGSSGYFYGGVVTYSNESKTAVLKVPSDMIEKNGAVSREVALSMAAGARKLFGSDIGVGITGIAGPGGGSFEKPVGTVYIGLNAGGIADEAVSVRYEFTGKRSGIRMSSVCQALHMIRKSALSPSFSKAGKAE